MGAINLRDEYINKILSNDDNDNDDNEGFLESLPLSELKTLAEDCS